jgi:hypothetical protein
MVSSSLTLIAHSLQDKLMIAAPGVPSPGQFFGRRSGRLGTLEGVGAPPERVCLNRFTHISPTFLLLKKTRWPHAFL